jgi:hypothetical protein
MLVGILKIMCRTTKRGHDFKLAFRRSHPNTENKPKMDYEYVTPVTGSCYIPKVTIVISVSVV